MTIEIEPQSSAGRPDEVRRRLLLSGLAGGEHDPRLGAQDGGTQLRPHHRPVVNAGKARNEGRQLLLRFEMGHPRVDEIRCHGAGAAGITVNALIPGLVDTPLTRYPKRFSESIGETRPNPPADPSPQEAWNVRAPTVPPRVGWLQPEDISPAAVFLASDATAMVTGAEYEVTGGDGAKDV